MSSASSTNHGGDDVHDIAPPQRNNNKVVFFSRVAQISPILPFLAHGPGFAAALTLSHVNRTFRDALQNFACDFWLILAQSVSPVMYKQLCGFSATSTRTHLRDHHHHAHGSADDGRHHHCSCCRCWPLIALHRQGGLDVNKPFAVSQQQQQQQNQQQEQSTDEGNNNSSSVSKLSRLFHQTFFSSLIPLCVAVIAKNFCFLEQLLEFGGSEINLSPTSQDLLAGGYGGYTPLIRAITHQDAKMVSSLIRHSLRQKHEQQQNHQQRRAVVVDIANEPTRQFGQSTPLVFAASCNSTEIMQILIEQGHADVNQVTPGGFSVLSLSVHKPDACSLLLKHGANPNSSGRSGRSVLFDAIEFGADEVVEMLLEAGADPRGYDVMSEDEAAMQKVLSSYAAPSGKSRGQGATPVPGGALPAVNGGENYGPGAKKVVMTALELAHLSKSQRKVELVSEALRKLGEVVLN